MTGPAFNTHTQSVCTAPARDWGWVLKAQTSAQGLGVGWGEVGVSCQMPGEMQSPQVRHHNMLQPSKVAQVTSHLETCCFSNKSTQHADATAVRLSLERR